MEINKTEGVVGDGHKNTVTGRVAYMKPDGCHLKRTVAIGVSYIQ